MSTSHLNSNQLAELKQLLEVRKTETEKRIFTLQDGKSRVEHARELLQQDESDANQHDADREVDLAANDRAELELARIKSALLRMETGEYGACDSCGCDIPYARLQVEPQTQHCVPCKSKLEGPLNPATM